MPEHSIFLINHRAIFPLRLGKQYYHPYYETSENARDLPVSTQQACGST